MQYKTKTHKIHTDNANKLLSLELVAGVGHWWKWLFSCCSFYGQHWLTGAKTSNRTTK